jgi:ATP-dependent helicase/nuclease subunit B
LRLVFDPALDGAAWPGPLGDREAVSGEAWVGPLGLLGVLETQLGLGGRLAGQLERACRLTRSLHDRDGFWRASFDRDRLGTSRRLIKERDTLAMWGWQGQPVSSRLGELARVTAEVLPGLPDRLARVMEVLGRRALDISSLTLFSPVTTMQPLWRAVLTGLAGAGVSVEQGALPTVSARGDLGRAQAGRFVPAGDGSLCLLRRHGLLDTADEVAAALAALDELEGVVIIGCDAVLDRALAQKGLPRLGLADRATASSGLVPLIVEAAFEPMEPEDLHALLAMDPGPVPRTVAAKLLDALRNHPGRRSREFGEMLAEGLERSPPEKREALGLRLTTLLMPATAHGAPLPVESLRTRLRSLRMWARACAAHVSSLELVCVQVDALEEAVELLGEAALTRAELRRLCSDLGGGEWPSLAAQAGLDHVASPGALLGPARLVFWWNFTRDQAPHPGRLFLTTEEEHGLASAGVTPPDFALLMEGEAQRWRRPLTLTSEALVLCCPRTGDDGQWSQIHPLWDELTASLERFEDVARLEVGSLEKVAPARSLAVGRRPLARPIPSVTVSTPIRRRELESPSSIERLIGCSLAWALHYQGHLRAGLSRGPALLAPLLLGRLAHDLLAVVLARNVRDPSAAAGAAAELFEHEAPRLCEAIALPRYQVQRATLKRAVVESARELTRLVLDAGARVVGTEMKHSMKAGGQPVEGQLDLVLASPDFVIDLKWGKSANREKLAAGTAVQLAAYAALRGPACGPGDAGGAADVGIGYFILRTQELLTGPQPALAGGYAPGRHAARAIWSATLEELRSRQADLARGLLVAPGANGEEATSSFDGARLRLAPACQYCLFGGLCGRGGVK